jgi:MinD-like ATPase involved in chromosome partitioning or flagellar assembly
VRTILFSSRAGGVGKSQIVVNLAQALTNFGLKVLVLDSNEDGHTSELVGKGVGFSVARLDGLNALLSIREDHGSLYDIVLVDSVREPLAQPAVDRHFLVLTPSPAVVARNRSLLASPVSDMSLHAVLNMVGEVKWREAFPDEIRRLYDSGRVFEVPYDPRVIISERSGELAMTKYPRCAFSIAVLRLAAFVGGLSYQAPPVGQNLAFARRILGLLGLPRPREGRVDEAS